MIVLLAKIVLLSEYDRLKLVRFQKLLKRILGLASLELGRGRVEMIRAKLWFKCAAMHDPVSPIIVQSSLIGWEAKKRRIDLVIERNFTGEELALRMKGWVTTDPAKVVEIINKHGRLVVLDDRELVIEIERIGDYEKMAADLKRTFGDEVEVELKQK